MVTAESLTVRVFGLEARLEWCRYTPLFVVLKINGLVHELWASSTGVKLRGIRLDTP